MPSNRDEYTRLPKSYILESMDIKPKIAIVLPKARTIFTSLTDVRVAGQVVFGIVVILVSWSGVKTIQTNYDLQKQIVGLQQQNDLQQLRNTNQRLRNDYYNSPQYLELSARQNYGLGVPGETEVVVPKSVALAYVTTPKASVQPATVGAARPFFVRNIEAWVHFFLHDQPAPN